MNRQPSVQAAIEAIGAASALVDEANRLVSQARQRRDEALALAADAGVFWVDGRLKALSTEEIDDAYLKKIVYFIADGLGWQAFVSSPAAISRIFEEAYARKICRPDVLFNLHQWTLCLNGLSEDMPRLKATFDGHYRPREHECEEE